MHPATAFRLAGQRQEQTRNQQHPQQRVARSTFHDKFIIRNMVERRQWESVTTVLPKSQKTKPKNQTITNDQMINANETLGDNGFFYIGILDLVWDLCFGS